VLRCRARMTVERTKILVLGESREPLSGATALCDGARSHRELLRALEHIPWSFPDASFDHVRADGLLAEVNDFFRVMEEIHRVCRPGALVEVSMPFMSSVRFASNPGNQRAAASASFDYFDARRPLGRYHYSPAQFQRVSFEYVRAYHGTAGKILGVLDKLVLPLCQRLPRAYEHYFAYWYPVHEVRFALRKV
jgi:ubiquinone/menaquinone biosynthesis C-methylase UbiE